MIKRCENPKNRNYKRYGGRGIKVCREWHNFETFMKDMGEAPPGLSLGRIDNDGPYCKNNCRWETIRQQQNNRSTNAWVIYHGKPYTVAMLALHLKISENLLRSRIRRGIPEQFWTSSESVSKYRMTMITSAGRTQSLRAWAEELGMPVSKLVKRYKKGYVAEQILSVRSLRLRPTAHAET